METRTERRKEETRRKIVAAALELFQANGFEAVSMERIAARADVARGTLYNHFPVKEAILDAYIRQSFQDSTPQRLLRIQALPDTRARMALVLNELLAGIRRQKELFERYFVYRIQQMIALKPAESAQSGLQRLELEVIRLGQAGGELRADLPQSLLLALFEFAFVEMAQLFYADPEHFQAETAVTQVVELFMNGAHANPK